MIILDTNVFSEIGKPQMSSAVRQWLTDFGLSLALTTITLAEVRLGVELLPQGRRRDELENRTEQLFTDFSGKIFGFDSAAARIYGQMVASRRLAGRPISTEDAMIAAICAAHHAQLATRNTKDFEGLTIELLNPWQD